VIAPVVRSFECRTFENTSGVPKVDSVLRDIGSVLCWVPLERHRGLLRSASQVSGGSLDVLYIQYVSTCKPPVYHPSGAIICSGRTRRSKSSPMSRPSSIHA